MGWALISTAFLQGLLGSTHCIGMCGPFVAILQTREGAGILSNIFYNFGRTLSYSLVGVALGFIGWGVNRFVFAQTAGIVGGVLIIVLGLGYIFPILPRFFNQSAPSFVTKSASQFLKKIPNISLLSFLMGSISGLLPCGLLYPAYSLALMAGDPVLGGLTMVSFSLGTYPMLMSLGLAGNRFLKILQNPKYRIFVGVLLIGFGLFTIWDRVQTNPEEEDCHTEIQDTKIEDKNSQDINIQKKTIQK